MGGAEAGEVPLGIDQPGQDDDLGRPAAEVPVRPLSATMMSGIPSGGPRTVEPSGSVIGLPRSATATATGASPAGNVYGGWKVPSPFPSAILDIVARLSGDVADDVQVAVSGQIGYRQPALVSEPD